MLALARAVRRRRNSYSMYRAKHARQQKAGSQAGRGGSKSGSSSAGSSSKQVRSALSTLGGAFAAAVTIHTIAVAAQSSN